MRLVYSFVCMLMVNQLFAQQQLPPVGQWRDHLPYNRVIDLTYGEERIYAATPYSVFSVTVSDGNIERFSKTSGLSETGISAIHFDTQTEKLCIVYDNSNIDFIYRNDIINVPDLLRDNTPGDKRGSHIFSRSGYFYLSTGLGVVVIDAGRYEIKETWLLGSNGGQVKVNEVTADPSFFYAATDEGLKKAAVNAANLADHNNWQLVSGTSGLPAGAAQQVILSGDKIICRVGDRLYIQQNSNWSLFYQDGWEIRNVSVSAGKIFIAETRSNSGNRVIGLTTDGTLVNLLVHASSLLSPRRVLEVGSTIWIADELSGLLTFDGTQWERIVPGSPAGIATGDIIYHDQGMFVASGGFDVSFLPANRKDGLYVFRDGSWSHLNHISNPALDSLPDMVSLAADARDKTIWAGSFGGGLAHIINPQDIEVYKQGYLLPSNADPSSYRVSGLVFDRENNLWIANYGAAQPLAVKKPDGSFTRFTVPLPLTENAITTIVVDDNNYKWMVTPKTDGLLVFDHGSDIESSGDDRWRHLTTGTGLGNLPGNRVLSLAKDKNGFIWIGTTNGIGVIQCPQEIFTAAACETAWPVVQRGNFAGYLFAGEEVQAIAVDGADRKWIATKNGVWLVSASGEEVLLHFSEDNNPLLNNDVRKIAVDGKTGEVFFVTAKGICSFRGTATGGGATNDELLVFPNPVPPGYTGTIAIRGLVDNAIVKITEMDGRLVYQTRAAGGQAVWNGRDYRGNRISSGVYLVLVSNDQRTEKKAGKIVFIQK